MEIAWPGANVGTADPVTRNGLMSLFVFRCMKTTTVSRRTFLSSLAVLPAIGFDWLQHERREQLELDHRVPVLMILSAHPTPTSAEKWRREYAMKPFDTMGEWYLGSTAELELPEALAKMPGTLTRFNYVAGAAAAKSSMLVGAFRRDHVACSYRVHGERDDVIALAGDFASRRIPDFTELLWNPQSLRSFIPTTERMGIDVSPSEAFWP